ncbi:MAG: hypothetical protein AUH85_16790 [Chloroflexi bacterium 13_1_40CM_4_68_4]|nr:MAG: hypothetical protein AUH85_16790 [Chloroflexi bacterium 13_1_40CM_4_68_4]
MDVVDAADLEALREVLCLGARGREDDRDRGGAIVHLQPATGVEAADARHHHVEQDQIRQVAVGDQERLFAIGGAQRLRAERLEPAREELHVRGLVVDDEHASERLGLRPRAADPHARGGLGAALLEEAREHGAKLGGRVRLGDEVVAAGLDGTSAVLLHRERGHGDDRDVARPLLLAQRLRHRPPIDAWQKQVHDDRVRMLRARGLDPGRAIGRGERLVARGANDPLRDIEVVRVVFDHQHTSHGHDLAPSVS